MDTDHTYEAVCLEGYDISRIREQYSQHEGDGVTHVAERIGFDSDGEFTGSTRPLTATEHEESVETKLVETITYHNLVEPGEQIVVGVSGGLDSTTLVRVLSEIRAELPAFDLLAVTVENVIPVEDPRPPTEVAATVESLGFEHRHVAADAIEERYGLTRSASDALRAIEQADNDALLGSIAPGIVHRMLTQTAREAGANAIFDGSHVTELVGGILNAWFTGAGTDRKSIPEHELGGLDRRYPLAYISKQELYRYRYVKAGRTHEQTDANPWDWFADEQHFYYYLADMLRTLWPGCEYWLFRSHNKRIADAAESEYDACANCGKRKIAADFEGETLCAVCEGFAEVDYLEEW